MYGPQRLNVFFFVLLLAACGDAPRDRDAEPATKSSRARATLQDAHRDRDDDQSDDDTGYEAKDGNVPATYDIFTNNTSQGMLTLHADEATGTIDFPAEGLSDPVQSVMVYAAGSLGSRSISFRRTGTYQQNYTGWMSSDGKVITGYLVNDNAAILSNEKFPFYAIKR